MSKNKSRVVLTGFMGVGKSTVAKCLASITKAERIDLDRYIEGKEEREIVRIIEEDGIDYFRAAENRALREILTESSARIIALGGGAFTVEANRRLIKESGAVSVWLEASFEHCWRNISVSKQARPLAKDKILAKKLFDERQKIYCLADWHLIVKPQLTAFDLGKFIACEIM